jgi:hypothetical protein
MWWIVLCATAAGCDPVRTTRQAVHVKVEDLASGEPLRGAQVWVKYDFESVPDPMHRQFWEEFPWRLGVTDNRGRAVIDLEYTELDRTRGTKPPVDRDATGKRYVFRIQEASLVEEALGIVLTRGSTVKGKRYGMSILDVQQPRYVATESRPATQPTTRADRDITRSYGWRE